MHALRPHDLNASFFFTFCLAPRPLRPDYCLWRWTAGRSAAAAAVAAAAVARDAVVLRAGAKVKCSEGAVVGIRIGMMLILIVLSAFGHFFSV